MLIPQLLNKFLGEGHLFLLPYSYSRNCAKIEANVAYFYDLEKLGIMLSLVPLACSGCDLLFLT